MTIDEAIKTIVDDIHFDLRFCTTQDVRRFYDALYMATEALEEKKAREVNEPLTWDELIGMYRSHVHFVDLNHLCLVGIGGSVGVHLSDVNGEEYFEKSDYGKTFLCYKYPPVESKGCE